jgi:hypothetical protein
MYLNWDAALSIIPFAIAGILMMTLTSKIAAPAHSSKTIKLLYYFGMWFGIVLLALAAVMVMVNMFWWIPFGIWKLFQ